MHSYSHVRGMGRWVRARESELGAGRGPAQLGFGKGAEPFVTSGCAAAAHRYITLTVHAKLSSVNQKRKKASAPGWKPTWKGCGRYIGHREQGSRGGRNARTRDEARATGGGRCEKGSRLALRS